MQGLRAAGAIREPVPARDRTARRYRARIASAEAEPAQGNGRLGLAIVVVNLEALRAPFEYRRFEGIPACLCPAGGRAREMSSLAETPFYPPHAVFENAEYVLNSTAHWRPLMNGYSGYTPTSYRDVAWTFWYFPDEPRSRRCAMPA